MRKMKKYKTAPCANVSFSIISKRLISGSIHTLWLPYIDELKAFVFRVPTFLTPRFIICDPIFAKVVLEGDSKLKCPAGDKSPNLKVLNNMTFGLSTILTKRNNNDGWEFSRKSIATSFSGLNLSKRFPDLQKIVIAFTKIVDTYAESSSVMKELPKWMVKLTIDFISKSMFKTDFDAIHGQEMTTNTSQMSYGSIFMTQVPIAIKEIVLKAVSLFSIFLLHSRLFFYST